MMIQLRVIVVGLALFAILWMAYGIAHADSLSDFERLPPDQQCGWKMKTFMSAVESRETGHARKIIHIDAETMEHLIAEGKVTKNEHGDVIMPKDGMYVQNFGIVSDRTKDFIAEIIYHGWDMADAWISADLARMSKEEPEWEGKLNALIHPATKSQWATEYYKACLFQYGKDRRVDAGRFIRVQSEHLDDSVDYESMELRLEGCRHNLPIYFHKCIIKDEPYSEAQIGAAVKKCNVVAWNKFFDCTKLYPRSMH